MRLNTAKMSIAAPVFAIGSSCGCVMGQVTPQRVVAAVDTDARAQVEQVGFTLPFGEPEMRQTIRLSLYLPRPGQLTAASVANPAADGPCLGSPESTQTVDGTYAPADLQPGLHAVILKRTLPVEPRLEDETTVDLKLMLDGQERCLRVPLTSALVRYRRPASVTLGVKVLVESFPIQAETQLFSLQAAPGFQSGIFRGQLSIGLLSFANCRESVCGTDTDSKGNPISKRDWAFPASVSIKAYPWFAQIGRFVGGVGLGARYSLVYSFVPAIAGDYRMVAHGVHGVLLLPIQRASPEPYMVRPAGAGMFEIEIPLGVWSSTRDGYRDAVVGGGFAVHWDASL